MRKPVFSYVNNKDADQPAHLCSLISIFVVYSLDNMISIYAISNVSRLKQVSVAEQAGFSFTYLQIPEDMFSRVMDHI